MDHCSAQLASSPCESPVISHHNSERGPPSRTYQPRTNNCHQTRQDERIGLVVPAADCVSITYRRPNRPTEISDSAPLTPFSTNDSISHTGTWKSGQQTAAVTGHAKLHTNWCIGFTTEFNSELPHDYHLFVVGLICAHNRNFHFSQQSAAFIKHFAASIIQSL